MANSWQSPKVEGQDHVLSTLPVSCQSPTVKRPRLSTDFLLVVLFYIKKLHQIINDSLIFISNVHDVIDVISLPVCQLARRTCHYISDLGWDEVTVVCSRRPQWSDDFADSQRSPTDGNSTVGLFYFFALLHGTCLSPNLHLVVNICAIGTHVS